MTMAPFLDTDSATGVSMRTEEAWQEARRRHHLARHGLISWPATLPAKRPVVRGLHDEETPAERHALSSTRLARKSDSRP